MIKELKSPREVSDRIKDSLNEGSKTHGDFTEHGYFDSRFTNPNYVSNKTNQNTSNTSPKKYSGWQIALIVLLILIALPIAGPIAFSAIGLIVSIFLTILCIFIVITILSVALLVCGLILFVVGFITLFSVPFAGIFTSGVGFIVLALGILFGLLTIWIYAKALPACIRGFVALCRLPFKNRRNIA